MFQFNFRELRGLSDISGHSKMAAILQVALEGKVSSKDLVEWISRQNNNVCIGHVERLL